MLALVVDGRTNRAIGSALFISEKTVSVHVSRILAKLGVANRAEAATLAHRLGLSARAVGRSPGGREYAIPSGGRPMWRARGFAIVAACPRRPRPPSRAGPDPADAFRRLGYRVVDVVADHQAFPACRSAPARSGRDRGGCASRCRRTAPTPARSWSSPWRGARRPGLRVDHPRFFAFVPVAEQPRRRDGRAARLRLRPSSRGRGSPRPGPRRRAGRRRLAARGLRPAGATEGAVRERRLGGESDRAGRALHERPAAERHRATVYLSTEAHSSRRRALPVLGVAPTTSRVLPTPDRRLASGGRRRRRRRPSRGPTARLRRRQRRHHRHRRRRPAAGAAPAAATRSTCGCTSTARTARRRRCRRAGGPGSPAWRVRTRSRSIRTSGSSSRSRRAACSCATGPRCGARSRPRPRTCPTRAPGRGGQLRRPRRSSCRAARRPRGCGCR